MLAILPRAAEPSLNHTYVRLGSFRHLGIGDIDPRILFNLQSVDLVCSLSRDALSQLTFSLSPELRAEPRALIGKCPTTELNLHSLSASSHKLWFWSRLGTLGNCAIVGMALGRASGKTQGPLAQLVSSWLWISLHLLELSVYSPAWSMVYSTLYSHTGWTLY